MRGGRVSVSVGGRYREEMEDSSLPPPEKELEDTSHLTSLALPLTEAGEVQLNHSIKEK